MTRPQEPLSQAVEMLGLTVRTSNSLRRCGVYTLGDLIEKDEPTLMAIPHFGATSLLDVYRILSYHGHALTQRCPTCGRLRDEPLTPEEANA